MALLMVLMAAAGTALTVALVDSSRVEWVTIGLLLGNVAIYLAPFWLEAAHRPFDPFHPLVYLFFIYWVPMVLVKGSQLALGGESFLLTNHTSNPWRCLNLALLYSGVGWLSTIVGFYSPLAASLSRRLRLPRWATKTNLVTPIPLGVLLLAGAAVNISLIGRAAFGSSLTEVQGPLVSLSILRPLSSWPLMVGFLVMFMVGRHGLRLRWGIPLIVVLCALGSLAVMSGSRAYLFQIVLALACAHMYGRGTERSRNVLYVWFGAAALALILGTAVMSQYRSLRFMRYGDNEISARQTFATVEDGAGELMSDPLGAGLRTLPDRFSERFSSVELLGVTIGLADSVRPEEHELGMDNNIWKGLFWTLVPRPLWPEKPQLSEFGYSFAALYLGAKGHTSAGPSMIGDLFRNFRVPGIVLGMFVFGVYLRVIYGVLILRAPGEAIAALVYWSLLTAVSLEDVYLDFFSGGTRNLFAVAGIVAGLSVWRSLRVRGKWHSRLCL